MSIKKEILNQLLDKYESSAHFKNEAKVNRRIMMDLKLPLYNIESPTQKRAVHMVLEELRRKKLVKVLWLERNHIAKQVQLNLDNVEQAYKEINRQDKRTALDRVRELCVPQDEDPDWLRGFMDHVSTFVDTKFKVPALIPSCPEDQQYLLIVLRAIAQLDGEEVLERIFSKRHLRDSKYFENRLRAKTARVLSRFKLKTKDLTPDQILQEAGLFRSSDELLFTGPISIEINNQTIDFTPLKYGTAIGARTVKELQIVDLNADTVITIENKASYREYCNQMGSKTLALYLAGFPGPMKKLFLRKLYDHAQQYCLNVKFLHWGDIDFGGFKIFRTLRDVVPAIEPHLMDVETLLRHREQCQELSKGYGKLLMGLLENHEYEEFHNVIEVMLRENIRLEQEGIL
jgi:hypothetical protein